MKPYTLEWWVRLHGILAVKSTECEYIKEWGDSNRYWDLMLFVEDRIINKYGE